MNLPTYITGSVQSKAYRILREHVYAVLTKYDLTPTSWAMLGVILTSKDGIRQTEIANLVHVKTPMVTVMARELQQRGLIHSVQNQFDARSKLLALTTEGKRFVRGVEISLSAELNGLLDGLTESDMETYHRVLTTIIANDANA